MQVFERSDNYRVVESDGTERFVPKDPANSDYQVLLAWIAEGGSMEPEPVVEVRSPHWTEFRLGMMTNEGYNRIAAIVYTAAPLLQQRLEMAMSFDQPHLETVQQLWQAWIALCPPSPEEIEQFQAVATATHVPIRFGASGEILL